MLLRWTCDSSDTPQRYAYRAQFVHKHLNLRELFCETTVNIQCSYKKQPLWFLVITYIANVDRFSKFFYCSLQSHKLWPKNEGVVFTGTLWRSFRVLARLRFRVQTHYPCSRAANTGTYSPVFILLALTLGGNSLLLLFRLFLPSLPLISRPLPFLLFPYKEDPLSSFPLEVGPHCG